jgi:hypothetical protein
MRSVGHMSHAQTSAAVRANGHGIGVRAASRAYETPHQCIPFPYRVWASWSSNSARARMPLRLTSADAVRTVLNILESFKYYFM